MSNPLNKQAISCKRWWKRTITRNLWFLAMLWYTAFHLFIITWWKETIEAWNQSGLSRYGGLISLAEIIITIAVRLCPLIWIIKSYNLLLKYKPSNKFFVKKWGIAGILRFIPVVCLYTKYRILKDLYFNLTEEKNRKKGTFYTRYIFYLLAWGFFIIYSHVSWMSDTNLLETLKINFLITSLMATIAIPSFNSIVSTIGSFCDTFNIVKWVIKINGEKIEQNNETVKNDIIVEKVKTEGVKIKKYNYKKIIFVIFIFIILLLIIWIFRFSKQESIKIQQKQDINNVEMKENSIDERNTSIEISHSELFELNQKCNELYKEKYITWQIYETFNWIRWISRSPWSREDKWEHRWEPTYYNYYIFYSPVEKSCVFSVKKERLECEQAEWPCDTDEKLTKYDLAEVKYFIEIIKSESNVKTVMSETYCYNPSNPWVTSDYCSDSINLKKYKNWFFWLVKEKRQKFENEVKRLEWI